MLGLKLKVCSPASGVALPSGLAVAKDGPKDKVSIFAKKLVAIPGESLGAKGGVVLVFVGIVSFCDLSSCFCPLFI